jgi:putative copper resistance protein D
VIAFLDVVLRGIALVGQATVIGGAVFAMLVLRPAIREDAAWTGRERRTLLLIAAGAAAVILAQGLAVALQIGTLLHDLGSPIRDALATSYVRANAAKAMVSLLVMATALALRRRETGSGWVIVAGLGVALGLAAAWTSHAAARLDHRPLLLALDALHQLAAGTWVGGLLHLVLTVSPDRDRPWSAPLLRRFSAVSLGAVVVLAASGAGLAFYYVGSWQAMLGTGYGLMVLTKVVILGGLTFLGAANFFTVRSLPASSGVCPARLRRFVEVELGLGLTVFFAAASLTSLPPAVDVVTDRATLAEVATRFTPRWPSLSSPPIEALPAADSEGPRTDEDREWSEYNHHVAGLFVLAMGLLAIAHRLGLGWARHWPLIFLALAAFLLMRSDPGSWPLGPQGFWEGMLDAEVLQHRLFLVLVVAFGVFEWMVRTGRLRSPRYALVFPILSIVGGGLLLTHSHALLDLKAEYLVEVTHTPLGMVALAIGWARWLELRLPAASTRMPARIWAVGLSVVGVLLLLYREN